MKLLKSPIVGLNNMLFLIIRQQRRPHEYHRH
ncbi:hypothetical protein Goarm_001710 [Gossypium armourianum]|uniref:Uncharacterized protein n=1 Tax=Gossypium armourianum TaxID=34283 RepID=A0A7J9K5X0_9ROSI|nr:hypothetical protein [Gossypium armourianum]